MASPAEPPAWRASFERLRAEVKAWYQAEAEALAARYDETGEVAQLDFSELTRRSQALLACEMIELIGEDAAPASAEDKAQLERVAQAMRAQGKEVPESIRTLLDE